MPHSHYYVIDDITPALVKQLYVDAENGLKVVERVAEEVTIPTINQLRYAGKHLSKYINDKSEEELTKAANHCQRAMYDAYETGIIYFISEINNFEKSYRKAVITDVLPDWVGYQQAVDGIKTFVDDRDKEERGKQSEICKANFKTLNEIFNTTKYSRSELNKVLKRDKMVARGVVIAFIALIFVVLAFLGINGEKAFTTDTEVKEATPPAIERLAE